jgi:hypothetical protein
VCAKYIDPSTGIRAICDCAPGFYGIDFCEPIADFVRLPPFFSALAGAHLKHPALRNGVYDETVITGSYFNERSLFSEPSGFSIPLNPLGRTVDATINTVFSAFDCKTYSHANSTTEISPTPSKSISLSITINEPLSSSSNVRYNALGMGFIQRAE